MTTFITGATSSIGRVLVKELASRGEPVRILVRANSNRTGLGLPGVEFIAGDVTDSEAVRQGMAGCDRVCHLAAVVGHQVSEAEWWRVNRDGTRNVLQAACDQGVKSVVQVSSIAVLGPTQPGEQGDESRLPDPARYINLYQRTKRAADEAAREFAARGLRVMIVYPSFGYGCSHASSHPSMAEMTLLRYAAGKPVAIMGSGRNTLNLAYYNDTVQGILLAHERGKSGNDYILGGENLTFPELWHTIARVLQKPPIRRRIPLPLLAAISGTAKLITGKQIFPPEFFEMFKYDWNYSTAKAQRDLDWHPTPFEQGLTQTWADYQAEGWRAE